MEIYRIKKLQMIRCNQLIFTVDCMKLLVSELNQYLKLHKLYYLYNIFQIIKQYYSSRIDAAIFLTAI